jgi:hypothetical protein
MLRNALQKFTGSMTYPAIQILLKENVYPLYHLYDPSFRPRKHCQFSKGRSPDL